MKTVAQSATPHHMFDDLFPEFVSTHLTTEQGWAYLNRYAPMRLAARTNYNIITTRANQGEAVTELILDKLLPHVDTPANRQRGLWIHLSSTMNGDLRHWHERAGWTEPQQWPTVTQAILEFVHSCMADPQMLDQACQNFSELTSVKGFQTGTLSPILNALLPTTYALLNNRSRRVLNHLAETNFTPLLQDYPAANRQYHQLLHELDPTIQQQIQHMASDAANDIASADLFDMFCHWLVTVKKFDFRGTRYWRLALDDLGQPLSYSKGGWWQREWKEWLEGSFVAMDGDMLGDISKQKRIAFNRLRDQLLEQLITEPNNSWTRSGINQIWTFAHSLREGDRIFVYCTVGEKQQVLLDTGTIIGPYYFVPNTEQGHCLPVEWDEHQPRLLPKNRWSSQLVQIDRARFETVLEMPVINLIVEEDIAEGSAEPLTEIETAPAYLPNETVSNHLAEPIVGYAQEVQPLPAYPLVDLATETGVESERLLRWANALERKGQIILYGPPGTGKTYIADQLARHWVSGENGGQDGFYELIQFHPTYAYEDFIQGIRPHTLADGTMTYQLIPGYFLKFCQRANACQHPCVLIIDEINRANLTRVFGELMYLLEYRERSVPLAGGGEPFTIPNNVYLIGTMNTADRSIAVVDYALRRRFAFIELTPDYEILRRWHQQQQTDAPVEPLIVLLQRLNAQIGDPHYALGTAFFLRHALNIELQDIWEMEIEPYLEEYFFDQPETVAAWRWSRISGSLL